MNPHSPEMVLKEDIFKPAEGDAQNKDNPWRNGWVSLKHLAGQTGEVMNLPVAKKPEQTDLERDKKTDRGGEIARDRERQRNPSHTKGHIKEINLH